jgi:hypothetical protein
VQSKLQEQEAMRRALHNTIQELKGNIRVFCRVRPSSADECAPRTKGAHAQATWLLVARALLSHMFSLCCT